MTTRGWLPNPVIRQGSITSDIFFDWLKREVLPRLAPGWILFMDNASIHRMAVVRELCMDYLVTLDELPPYSPDFNPIEQAFHVLKIWIKRHQLKIEDYVSFGRFL
jgi:transposase